MKTQIAQDQAARIQTGFSFYLNQPKERGVRQNAQLSLAIPGAIIYNARLGLSLSNHPKTRNEK